VDFDIRRDRHAAQSVAFLRSQGFDFNAARVRRRLGGVWGEARRDPIGAAARGRGRRADVIGERRCAGPPGTSSWRAYNYDLAYLVRMLSDGQPLPKTRQGFVARVRG
jgi:CCR4-NOT transcription complex subunit 7/8